MKLRSATKFVICFSVFVSYFAILWISKRKNVIFPEIVKND